MSVEFVVNKSPTGTTAATLALYSGAELVDDHEMDEQPEDSGRWRVVVSGLAERTYDFRVADQDNFVFATGSCAVDANGNEITLATLADQTGTGAIAATITVLDQDGEPVAGASVSVRKGPLYHEDTTDEYGLVSFSLDAGDWTVAIYHVSYQSFTPVTFDPDDTPDVEYEIEELEIDDPISPAYAIVRATLLGSSGPVEGATFSARMIGMPSGSGVGYIGETYTSGESDSDGLAQMQVPINGEYEFWFGGGSKQTAVVDESPFTVPSMLGAETP